MTRTLTQKGVDVNRSQHLLHRASEKVGGDSELARELQVHRQQVYEMRHGKRRIDAASAAICAQIVGEDSGLAAIRAAMDYEKNQTIVERLAVMVSFTKYKLSTFGARFQLGQQVDQVCT